MNPKLPPDGRTVFSPRRHGVRTDGRTTRNFFVRIAPVLLSLPAFAGEPQLSLEERQAIEAAAPSQAFARPARPRKLLVFDLNVGYGGHGSIRFANHAFAVMGSRTGAFEAVVSRDPAVLARESLARFDAVLLNNTVGNLSEDPALRESLRDFIYEGGGLLGYHGSSVAFQKWPGAVETWPEFGRILGARGCSHREPNEHVFLKIEDPAHPVTRPLGAGPYEHSDEYFRFIEPYSRERNRVLLSIDTAKTDLNQGRSFGAGPRADGDYAVSWVREYGRGRVFYLSFGHGPPVFRDPTLLRFWLAGIQFALGDLPAGTTPSAKLTPAARAFETIGWRIGLSAGGEADLPLADLIGKAAAVGVRQVGARIDPGLSDADAASMRDRLAAADVRLATCRVASLPREGGARRRLFALARKLGAECVIAAQGTADLGDIGKLCDEFRVALAVPIAAEGAAAAAGTPGIGVSLEVGPRGFDARRTVEALDRWKGKVLALRFEAGGEQEASAFREVLGAVRRLGLGPMTIDIAIPGDRQVPDADLARPVRALGEAAIDLAGGGARGAEKDR